MNASISKYNQVFKRIELPKLNKLGFKIIEDLKWYEEKILDYLFLYFQKGYFIFIDKIFKYSNLQIDNIPGTNMIELIELTFIKFLSQRVSFFENFLLNWSRKINIDTLENPTTFYNHIEGKILWKETFLERNFLRYPKSIKFVCVSQQKSYDTLENVIIKSFLNFLKNLFEKKMTYFRTLSDENKNKEEDWRYHAIIIYNTLNKILRNYHISEITLKKNEWKNKFLISKAIRACHKENLLILIYANLFTDLKSLKNQDLIKSFFINYLIKPNQDKSAELFVLFTIIQKLASLENGIEIQYLISLNSKKKYIFKKVMNDNRIIKVYYQRRPNWISIKYSKNSCFTKILNHFDFKNNELRPDIIIEISNLNIKKLILIEVKNTTSKSYIRDGLHQICDYFDYLKYSEKYKISKNEGFLVVNKLPEGWKNKFKNKNNSSEIKVLEFQDLNSIDEFPINFNFI